MVEMVLDSPFMGAGHDDDLCNTRRHCFFYDVLDDWFVDDGKHLFGHSFGLGKEARPQTGGGNDGFGNLWHKIELFTGQLLLPILQQTRAVCTLLV